jgi:hypothetical protein
LTPRGVSPISGYTRELGPDFWAVQVASPSPSSLSITGGFNMRYILSVILLLFSVFALPLDGAKASTAIIC